MTGRGPFLMAAAVGLLAAPASASADITIQAIPFDRYEAAEYTIDAGEKVTFTNYDVSDHDVVGPGFRSSLIGFTESAPVAGAETLAAGRYDFVCSVHPSMRATLVVNGSMGAPPPQQQPPPSEESPPGQPEPAGQPQAADTKAPGLKMRLKRRGRDVVARISVDEAAQLRIRVGRSTRTRGVGGPRTFTIRFRNRVRRSFQVVLTATDTSGNESGLSRRWRARR